MRWHGHGWWTNNYLPGSARSRTSIASLAGRFRQESGYVSFFRGSQFFEREGDGPQHAFIEVGLVSET